MESRKKTRGICTRGRGASGRDCYFKSLNPAGAVSCAMMVVDISTELAKQRCFLGAFGEHGKAKWNDYEELSDDGGWSEKMI